MIKGSYSSASFNDSAGLTVGANASIQVNREDTGALAVLWADKDGTVPLGNPFAADAHGMFTFYIDAANDQGFKVAATVGGNTITQRNVSIGSSQYFDFSIFVATLVLAVDAPALVTLLGLRYKTELIERAARRARLYAAQNLV